MDRMTAGQTSRFVSKASRPNTKSEKYIQGNGDNGDKNMTNNVYVPCCSHFSRRNRGPSLNHPNKRKGESQRRIWRPTMANNDAMACGFPMLQATSSSKGRL